jgi:DNA polymerase
MSDLYHQLLEAAIVHLQALKERGEKFVSVSPETLAALASPLAPSANPAASPRAGGASPPPIQNGAAADSVSQAMAELRSRVLTCQKCPHLVRSRKNVVFGVGHVQSPLMFIGEAPGVDEDEQGEPFVGRAGQLLTKIIQAMGFTRQTVYIANILKCRPDTPALASGNRKPTTEEMETCLPYLLAQIELIKPKVIVALGATAVEGLLGKTAGITKLRGAWQSFRAIPLMPTFHPSFLLRPENVGKKRLVWEDMLQVLEKLGCPISAKQRGYFQK